MVNFEAKHLEDFLTDYSFQSFVTGDDKESGEKWRHWIEVNPQAKKEFDTAVKVMKLLLKTRKQVSNLHTEQELKELLAKIQDNEISLEDESSPAAWWWRVAGIILLLISVSIVFYFALKPKQADLVAYNEVIVPLGEKAQIVLADGSHIWINSSSKIKYPVAFDKKERKVYLEGEAFFDVTRNEKHPFIVYTPDLKVKVLGTSFNVKNYPNDKNAVMTVVRGLVSVESKKNEIAPILINPNENYVLNTSPVKKDKISAEPEKQTDQLPKKVLPIINKKVNVEAITSWKDQMLIFFDEPLEDVALKMERWYNVKVHILNGELKKERYRGKFVNNETIYQVLEAIKFTTPISYKTKNNEFFIDKPK
ncbi:MAG TPA: FecR domain-containing protein [Bacteroidales bacterium]|nr:FecR domain-containing protein [Bacteroidales bacterium]